MLASDEIRIGRNLRGLAQDYIDYYAAIFV